MKDNDITTYVTLAFGVATVLGLGYLASEKIKEMNAEKDKADKAFLQYVMEDLLMYSNSARTLYSPMRRSVIQTVVGLSTNLYNIQNNTCYATPEIVINGARPTPDLKEVKLSTRRSQATGRVYCY